MASVSSLLSTFRTKIEEAVALVPTMVAEEKLQAVQFWNVVSERLQEIVNNSAADISALAFEMEKQNAAKAKPESQPPTDVSEKSRDLLIQDNTSIPIVDQLSDTHMTSYRLAISDPVPSALESTETEASTTTNLQTPIPLSSNDKSLDASTEPVNTPDASNSSLSTLPPTQPSRLSELLTADTGPRLSNSAKDPVKTNANAKYRKAKNSNSGKWDNNDSHWKTSGEKSHQGQDKVEKKIMNVRRQPPRSKRRKKNFALATDSDGSDVDVDSIKVNDVGENGSEVSVIDDEEGNSNSTNAKDDVPDENGASGIILMNAKSLRGTDDDEWVRPEGDDADAEEEEMTVNDDGHYVCGYCKKSFESLSAYTTHKYCHTKPFACTECDARFSTKGNLIVHVRRHTGEKPFICSMCEAKFSTKGNLKRHVKTHSGERPWHCPQCGGRFTEKKSLKVHMRRHTGEKPYRCNVCGKQFAQTGILQTHMAMHMDQKEHLCEHCGKSFRQKSQLRLHMMRHEGVRKYQCASCPSKFLTKGDLERHNRIHTGERPFVCELCGKTFTRQQSLNEHMNRHYGLKPYQCKYCGKAFAEMSACYKHIKQHERLGHEREAPSSGCETPQLTIDCESQKFTVLVQTDQSLDVGSEISVVQHDHIGTVITTGEPEITVAVSENIGDFAAINLLANASTFQQNF